jgi:serine/threonine-protein kinase
MATVHFGRLLGPVGFSRTVAIKRLLPHYARDPEFVAMFLDEARLAARIRHPNVVPTLDVVASKGELFLVMEYVQGESLARLARDVQARSERIPPPIVAAILSGALQGLHAAHEARDESGRSLNIVHRDVSPQNLLVGIDGMVRVLDFGVAKAAGRVQTTQEGQVKGKFSYMAPEQLEGPVTRAADIFSAAVILWEALCGRRLYKGDTEAQILARVLKGAPQRPSEIAPELAPYDAVVLKGLAKKPDERHATAREMALDLEKCGRVASQAEVADWLEHNAGTTLRERAQTVAQIEQLDSASVRADILKEKIAEHLAAEHSGEAPSPWAKAPAADAPTASKVATISVSRADPERARSARARAVRIAALVGIGGAAALAAFLVAGRVGRVDEAPSQATRPASNAPAIPPAPVAEPAAPGADPLPAAASMTTAAPSSAASWPPTASARTSATAAPTAHRALSAPAASTRGASAPSARPSSPFEGLGGR